MADKFSNETLHEILIRIEGRVKTLNGNVARNTAFRFKTIGGFLVIGFLTSIGLVGVVALWVKMMAT